MSRGVGPFGNRPVNEGSVDLRCQQRQRFAQGVSQTDRLLRNAAQLLEDGRFGVGLVVLKTSAAPRRPEATPPAEASIR
jgi:hypothetical protein